MHQEVSMRYFYTKLFSTNENEKNEKRLALMHKCTHAAHAG